jgi:transcriptional regulator with XRE-family HTH domain
VTEEIAWSARLGEHLEASRKRAGLRRVQLASQLQVSEETIRLWEKGTVQPSAERLSRLIALISIESSDWPVADAPARDLPPLAHRLRNERDGRGITQAEAIEILDLPQATYAGWETGRSTPGAAFFPRLAEFMGIAERDVATLCSSPFIVDTSGWPPFGQFVGARRQELGLGRAELAAAVGVSQRSVVSWELGYRAPGSKQLPRLAAALSVDTASLAAALPRLAMTTALGDLVLERQRELGMASADLARLVGTTESTVSRWVHGRSHPVHRNLQRLAEVLMMPYETIAAAAGQTA